MPGATVAEVLDAARARYGPDFTSVLGQCQVWCNGEPTSMDAPIGEDDEIGVLPPVSGGDR